MSNSFFGINSGELLVIVLVAILVIGPERIPGYAQSFREWVVRGRDYVKRGQETIAKETGADVDWSKLDPRQYDPRHIVRDALWDGPRSAPVTTRATGPAAAGAAATKSGAVPAPAGNAPFDDEAT